MPPGIAPRISEDQVEGHEDRIQRLERAHTEVSAQLASQTVQIGHLNTSIDRIENTLERGLASVASQVENMSKPLTEKMEKVVDLVEAHSRDIAAIQKTEADRAQTKAERLSTMKKWVLGVSLTIGGAIGTKLAGMLYAWVVGS